ncbi:MAG: hypothetical protein JEY99_10445 [Spirochaetales bacterium]|nr:hypothetical protein [Spirochaetales bacterium]
MDRNIRQSKTAIKGLLLILLYLSIQMGGQVLAKYASGEKSLFNIYTMGSYLSLLSRGFIWVLILNRIRLIAAYPINGLSYILILPLSALIFEEVITSGRVASSVMIASGVVLLTIGELISSGKISSGRQVSE